MGMHADDAVGECVDDYWDYIDRDEPVYNDGPYYPIRIRAKGLGPCPKCGGETVLREGPYGKFWGCKGFPECKGNRDY